MIKLMKGKWKKKISTIENGDVISQRGNTCLTYGSC